MLQARDTSLSRMYNSFFGFTDQPFNVTPDPRFYYANRSYQEAHAALLYGVRERKGFVVLTGEVGIGKTTLLRRLIGNLGENVRVSFLYHTNLSFDELLLSVCEDFGLQASRTDRMESIKVLNAFLIDRLAAGETAVLVIDEAQNLRVDALEELRVLSNLETASEKLLQIILVGQPELEEKLNRQDLRQLKQRIAIRCRLRPLEPAEVGHFVRSRLSTVGYDGPELFAPDVMRRIAEYSMGLPRLINNICDNALLIAFATKRSTVPLAVVDEVAHDLELVRVDAGAGNDSGAVRGEDRLGEWPAAPAGAVRVPPARTEHECDPGALGERSDGQAKRSLERKPPRRIGRVVLAALVVLLTVMSALYLANPYQIRERLMRSGFRAAGIAEVIRYVRAELNTVLEMAGAGFSANRGAIAVTNSGARDAGEKTVIQK